MYKLKTQKMLVTWGGRFIQYGAFFWFLQTLYFIGLHGWHVEPINDNERIADLIAGVFVTTGTIMVFIGGMSISRDAIDENEATRKALANVEDLLKITIDEIRKRDIKIKATRKPLANAEVLLKIAVDEIDKRDIKIKATRAALANAEELFKIAKNEIRKRDIKIKKLLNDKNDKK